jgi:hypothetical protein
MLAFCRFVLCMLLLQPLLSLAHTLHYIYILVLFTFKFVVHSTIASAHWRTREHLFLDLELKVEFQGTSSAIYSVHRSRHASLYC